VRRAKATNSKLGVVETQQHTSRVIGDWIQFYNHRRPHQVLSMKISPKCMF
jgi:hypothetical protein